MISSLPPSNLVFISNRAAAEWYERQILEARDLEECQVRALVFIRMVFEDEQLRARLPGVVGATSPERPAS